MRILVLVLILFSTSKSLCQSIIEGTITTENNTPLPYVTVTLKGTNKGTSSDEKGKFTIENVQSGSYSIYFSSVGYISETKNITVSEAENIKLSISLKPSQENLDEIVISSNRTRETLDEVPSSVSILTSKQIERFSQTSTTVADVLNEIPGIALSTNQTSNTGQTLRGRKMLVLIDGIPQSTPLRNGNRDINTIDPATLERIEVIKGATAIYGNGADGGIVNYITKKTKSLKSFESTTRLGANGSLAGIANSAGIDLTQQFSGNTQNLGYVFSGTFRQTGVFKDANGEVISPYYGIGETSQYSLFGKLNYQITNRQDIEFMYNYFSSNQDSNYIIQVGEYGETPTIGVLGEGQGVDQGTRYNHNTQLTYNFRDIFSHTDFKLNLYLQDFKTIYGFTDSFYNPELGLEGGQSSILSTKKGARFNFKTSYNFGNVNGNILYGLDVLNDVTSQELVDGRSYIPELDMTNYAPYTQLKTRYQDFVLKAGIRFENINIDVPDFTTMLRYNVGSQTPRSGGVAVDGGKVEYDATTYNIGLRYNKWEVFKPFVSFSQSFSIADLGRTLRAANSNAVELINSEAVIADNYEVGFNSKLGKTRVSGAYFISTSDLGLSYHETENGVIEIARQPERVYGFEANVSTPITSNLNVGGNISYTEGKLDVLDNDDYDTYMNGDRIPPLKTVAYISYNYENRLNARLSYIYSGERDHFEPNENGAYSYGQGPVTNFNIVNLTSSYKVSEHTKIGLGIENLLNEDYYNLLSQWAARDSDYIKANGIHFNVSCTLNL